MLLCSLMVGAFGCQTAPKTVPTPVTIELPPVTYSDK